MKSFKFNLESVYKVRKNTEKKKIAELAKVSSVYNKEMISRDLCFDNIKKTENTLDNIDTNSEEFINNMLFNGEYISLMQKAIKEHENKMDSMRYELDTKQKALAKAAADRRAVELIKEKRFMEYKKECLKEEQKELDEHSSRNKFVI